MKEQRRHQRIRFGVQPLIRIGQSGVTGIGRLENLSLGGLMLRTDLPLSRLVKNQAPPSVFHP